MFAYKDDFLMGSSFDCEGQNPAICTATNTARDQLDELARLVGSGETTFNGYDSDDVTSPDSDIVMNHDLEAELARTFENSVDEEAASASVFDTSPIENAFAQPQVDQPEIDVDFNDMIDSALEKALQEEVAAESQLRMAPSIAPVPPQPSTVSQNWDAPEIVAPPVLPMASANEIHVAPAPGFEPAQTHDIATPSQDFSDPAADFQIFNHEAAPMPQMIQQPEPAAVQDINTFDVSASNAVIGGAAVAGVTASANATDYQAMSSSIDDEALSIPDAHELMAVGGQGRSGRKAAIAIVAVALLGGSAALAVNMFNGDEGAAPTILASSDPVKVKPKDVGGKVVPNQDQAVYRSVEGKAKAESTQVRLKDSTEKPIAVAAKSQPKSGESNTKIASANGQVLQPRKVRTVVVKPDGTIVSTVSPAASQGVKVSQPTLALRPKLEDAVVPTKLEPAPRTVKSVKAKPVVKPVKVAKLQPKPKKVKVAAPKRVVKKAAPKKAKAAALPAKKSAYAVQIASQRSPDAAKRSYQTLSRKYASVIGGKGVDIRKGVIKGKGTYYRVRIPANSRAAANKICSQLKNRGGSCFVTR